MKKESGMPSVPDIPSVPKVQKQSQHKAPPQAVELEKAVLAALLIDKSTHEKIELLEPEIFYSEIHRFIFQSIQNLYNKSSDIDLLSITEELRRMNRLSYVGGEYVLIELTQSISTGLHIEYHIRILCQKYVLRKLISMSQETISDSLHNDPDIFNLLDRIDNKIAQMSNVGIRNLSPVESDAKEELKERVRMKREGIPVGYPTGMDEFDDWCGGFQKRWLVTIGARPGMGKTSAIIAIIYHMAFVKGVKVVFYSLEMSKIDIEYRLAARMTGIPFSKINMGELTDEELDHVTDACQKIEEHGIKIIDDIKNLNKITAETRKLKLEGYEVFMLDYLQLIEISGSTSDMTGEMVQITRTLKSLKNSLSIPFIALSQIDRSVDNRPSKRPQLSDLKQSSSIEQDSDLVIFLLRLAYYEENKSTVPAPPGKPNPAYVAEWIVAKGRGTGTKDFGVYLNLAEFVLESGTSVQF